MKWYIFNRKDKNNDLKIKKLNISKIIKISIVIIFILIIISLIFEYKYNDEFREFFDVKILRKEISNENTLNIDISYKSNPFVYTYYKYITILDKNILEVYTNTSKADFTLEVSISNPIYADNNRFLCVAEKSGNKVYLISGLNILWQKDVDGQISKLNVNKNGYVAVVTSNSGYKTIITLYNPNGDELFKTYLPTTYTADIEISDDNKYLAIAEVDTSGTFIQSGVRIVSIENAKTNAEQAFVKNYNNENKNFILNLKYQDKNKLICMYSDKIISLEDETNEITKIDSNISFVDIDLNNYVAKVVKQVGGVLKADYYINLINTVSLKESSYKLSGLPKAIYCNLDNIAINYGTEVEIINTGGWLMRRYKSLLQEIKDIKINNNIAVVIYKDTIEVINL